MKKFLSVLAFLGLAASLNASAAAPVVDVLNPQVQGLTKVADFKGVQVTGVTVTETGRVFANFPRWRKDLPYSVVEINPDGSSRPYPDPEWNTWNGQPQENHFTCVQSVVAHGNSLFVLDPSSPEMKGVVGRPMLYEFDLQTNQLKNKWMFKPQVAPKKSYLNDLRIDAEAQMIYITDSGLGGVVVLDLKADKARRVLSEKKMTKAEDVTLMVNGKPFLKDGKPARIHSDGIALREGFLYFHALTGYHLYRVPTSALNDQTLSASKLSAQVEDLGKTPAPDGMMFDQAGNLYLGDLEKNAIVYRTPNGEIKTLLQDAQIKWPDTFAIDSQNNFYFTDSRLDEAPAGKPATDLTFSIYKIALPK